MIKFLTIIGARPQIIKAAALSRTINEHYKDKINEIIVHTGQHYDQNMSEIFFKELNIPKPKYNLNVGSASHAFQTANMIIGIEKIIISENPDYVIIYGDTNSTLAAAVAASKLSVPIVHIEAGLRSFNKTMPEEINRIFCDHVSTFLFVPTLTGINNLKSEGFNLIYKSNYNIDNPAIYHCGDIMYDNSIYFSKIAEEKSKILKTYNLEKNNFLLITIHRDNNTDNSERLNSIFEAIYKISIDNNIKALIPLHPRTSKAIENKLNPDLLKNIRKNNLISIIEPVSFFDMIILEKNCFIVITDSGGVQKEAYFFKKPSIILRSETEWKEIVENGTAIIANSNKKDIINAFNFFKSEKKLYFPQIFGNAKASEFICKTLYDSYIKK